MKRVAVIIGSLVVAAGALYAPEAFGRSGSDVVIVESS